MSNRSRRSLVDQTLTFLLVSLLTTSSMVVDCVAQARPTLKIVVVQGDGAVNNVKQRVAREMIVQVQDENDRPIAGAAVVFLLPRSGSGGTFAKGSRVLNVVTDGNGRAVAQSFQPNKVVGSFKIDVQASFQGQTATTSISGSNAAGAASAGAGATAAGGTGAGAGVSAATVGLIVGAIGVATATGVILAKRSGGSSTPSGTIGVGTGPVFAPPRPN